MELAIFLRFLTLLPTQVEPKLVLCNYLLIVTTVVVRIFDIFFKFRYANNNKIVFVTSESKSCKSATDGHICYMFTSRCTIFIAANLIFIASQ